MIRIKETLTWYVSRGSLSAFCAKLASCFIDVNNAHYQLVVREALGNRPGVCLRIVGSHYNPSQAITVFSSPL